MIVFPDEIDGYRKLLSSVLWLAVYDACSAPVKATKAERTSPCEEARSAVRFLFSSDRPYFNEYMQCLGMDVQTFRSKLLLAMYDDTNSDEAPFERLPHNAKKSFRFNHSYWLKYTKQCADPLSAKDWKYQDNTQIKEPSWQTC